MSIGFKFALLGFKNHDLISAATAANHRGASPSCSSRSSIGGGEEWQQASFRNLDWDRVNRQLIQAEAAKEGADRSGAREPAHAG